MTTALGNLVFLYALITGIILPFLVDLVTKRFANPPVKASLLLVLSLASGIVNEWVNAAQTDTAYNLGQAITVALLSLIAGVSTLFGLSKPLGISGSDGAIQKALPGGVGPSNAAPSLARQPGDVSQLDQWDGVGGPKGPEQQ